MKINLKIISLIAALLVENQAYAAEQISTDTKDIKTICAEHVACIQSLRTKTEGIVHLNEKSLSQLPIRKIESNSDLLSYSLQVIDFQQCGINLIVQSHPEYSEAIEPLKQEVTLLKNEFVAAAAKYKAHLDELKAASTNTSTK